MNFKPYEGNEPYIFISYSHQDIPKVCEILEKLSTAGFRIWYDFGIPLTADYNENIARHIVNSSAVIVFLSPNSVKSDYCQIEIYYACDNKKTILPVYLEQTKLPVGIDMRLQLFQAINLHDYPKREDFYRRIFNTETLKPCMEEANMIFIQQRGQSYASAYYRETDPIKKAALREMAIHLLQKVVDRNYVFKNFIEPELEALKKTEPYEINSETVAAVYQQALIYLEKCFTETNLIEKFLMRDKALMILKKIAASEFPQRYSAKEKLASFQSEDTAHVDAFKELISRPQKYRKK